jgi:dethiobiotin synthetase
MVPLTDAYCYLDLAADLGLPVLIVARPGLGTINHTMLTISVLRERRLNIAGVVINHATADKTGVAGQTNSGVIEKLSGIEILGIIPYRSRCAEHIASKLFPLQQPSTSRKD